MEKKVLTISSGSPTKETAGSIVKSFFDDGVSDIELRAIGAGAVNQMFKAMATARSIFAQKGLDMYCRPGYDEIEINNEKRTVMIARLVIS